MTPRARIAVAAVLTHVCLGSVYAWSVFVPALIRATGWNKPQVTWAFSFAIATLGLTAALASPWMHRLGPRRSVTVSAFCFAAGLAMAGLAVKIRSLGLLYGGFGLVGGVGLGMGYVPPVTTLLRWFFDRKGLATGLAVGGFGIGALVASYVAEACLVRMSVSATFLVLAGTYGVVLLGAARVLRLPEDTSAPAVQAPGGPLFGGAFLLIWSAFFLNIATGILLIALARPMLEDWATQGSSPLPVVTVVAVMGLFNGLGRLGWSSLSDRLGRTSTWMVMFTLQALLFFLLWRGVGAWALAAGLWLIASCYGGGFALCPALVADLYGPQRAPRLYGLALTAWSAAALLSPPLAAWMREATGSYSLLLAACAICSLAGGGVVLVLRSGRLRRDAGTSTI